MSSAHSFDVIVIGGGHAGQARAVVNCLEGQFAPVSDHTNDGVVRVSRLGQDGRADETEVPALRKMCHS